jgi:Mn-containing catalase
MFFHKKLIMHPVKVDAPNPQFAQLLLEQFGGATGELTAALQYWVQSFHCENAGIRDMLQDIAIEEFSHLEVVGRLIESHTKDTDQTEAYKSTLFSLRGIGPHFLDSQGNAWSAKYINEGGDVVRDLRCDIAAEAGARQTYEELIKMAPDKGTKDTLVFLLTREISHTQMFMKHWSRWVNSLTPSLAIFSRMKLSIFTSTCPVMVKENLLHQPIMVQMSVALGIRSRILSILPIP